MQQKEDIIKKLHQNLDELKVKVENEVNLCMDETRAEEKLLVESLRDELKEFRLESLDNKEEIFKKLFVKQREKTIEFYNKKQNNCLDLISKNKKEMVDLLKTIKDENPDVKWDEELKEIISNSLKFCSELTSRIFDLDNKNMSRTLDSFDKEVQTFFGTKVDDE